MDPYATEPKQRHLFELLEGLVRAQEESITQIRAAEREVRLSPAAVNNTVHFT